MTDEEPDVRRIRVGFGILAVVLLACLVGARQVDAAGPRFLLVAIALFTLVRLFLLMRQIRRRGRS